MTCKILIKICLQRIRSSRVYNANNNEHEPNAPKDEIIQFQNARYISSSEACHRIYQYLTNAQYPPTERLPVHCKDEHSIYYDEKLIENDTLLNF